MSNPTLARRLGTTDAVVIGLSAMIGAGVFSVFGPAAGASSGGGLLVGLALAAIVATCNAISTAQLATTYPSSGGTYLYGREVLGEWWGFLAGWAFVVGKTASCAAMAMTFAAYAVPGSTWAMRAAAVGAVLALTVANLRGVTRTALVARVLLGVTLVALVVTTVAVATGDPAPAMGSGVDLAVGGGRGGVLGVLQAAGLLFFAFAGYARIATLAEEVRRPEVLTRAVLVSLAIVVVLYAVIGLVVVRALGDDLVATTTPLADAADAAGVGWVGPLVRVGAVTASLGALLALLAGVGRTTLAMARGRDLPGWLTSISPAHRVPDHAQVSIAVVVVALVLVADLRQAIGFSSCGVLVYYAVANLAALRQPAAQRRCPRAVPVVGLIGCLVLVATLPGAALVGGVVVLVVGVAVRGLRTASGPRSR